MSEGFDGLSRTMADRMSRRGALRAIAATAIAAATVTIVKPFKRAGAVTCPPGGQLCGEGCCPSGQTCTDPATGCCCAAGLTPCGTRCCNRGLACLNSSAGLCGCPAGMTQCFFGGSTATCCPAGQACGSPSCQPSSNFNTSQPCFSTTTTTTTTTTTIPTTTTTTTAPTTTTTTTAPCNLGAVGAACGSGSDCCSGFCRNTDSRCCLPDGSQCVQQLDCCSTNCNAGTCGPQL